MKHKIIISLSVALATQMAVAQNHFIKPADAIKYRQSMFFVMSIHTQRIGAMAKGEQPYDKAALETNAAVIEMLSKQMSAAFPSGSDIPPSKAKPEVWQEAAQFKSKMEEFQIAASKLAAAAKSGDPAAMKSTFNIVSQSCKACHENYRNR